MYVPIIYRFLPEINVFVFVNVDFVYIIDMHEHTYTHARTLSFPAYFIAVISLLRPPPSSSPFLTPLSPSLPPLPPFSLSPSHPPSLSLSLSLSPSLPRGSVRKSIMSYDAPPVTLSYILQRESRRKESYIGEYRRIGA